MRKSILGLQLLRANFTKLIASDNRSIFLSILEHQYKQLLMNIAIFKLNYVINSVNINRNL